jgi:glycosyltransferase involved in cell wall biosynthesis
LKIISKKPLVRSFPYLSERNHFRKIYEDFKPDITHTGYVWQVGILAAINNVHPHLSMPWASDILIEPDKSMIRKRIVRKVMNQADHIHCDSAFVKQKIINDYNLPEHKITVFPIGIDLKLFHPMNKQLCRQQLHLDDKFLVLFNRSLEPIYGIEYLLKGFKDFVKDKSDVLLMMFSAGSLLGKVKRFIKNNSLEKKIRIFRRIPYYELPLYLNASDVYISTSLSDGSSFSLLEAMACNINIIISDVPSILEWISEENGLVIKRKDAQAVTRALNTLYNNREVMKESGQKNLFLVRERADWDKNYLKLKEIYQKLLEPVER